MKPYADKARIFHESHDGSKTATRRKHKEICKEELIEQEEEYQEDLEQWYNDMLRWDDDWY